jgi:hypothetical protein
MNGRIYADERGLECLFLAICRPNRASPNATALTPKPDIKNWMSASTHLLEGINGGQMYKFARRV